MITSASGTQMKHVRELLSKSRARAQAKEYVVEGVRMCREIPAEDLKTLYVAESFAAANDLSMFGTEPEIVKDFVMEKISDTKTPQGILAVAKQPRWKLEDLLSKEKCTLFFLENLQDPGNLGTIIRCAEGAGVDGVILSAGCADAFSPKVIRSTMGSIFRVPVISVEDFQKTLKDAQNAGFQLYAAHLKGRKDYDQVAYPGKSGILIGNEAAGLSERAAEACDELVKIPMEGHVESLNAAVAASVFMYEIYRQKRRNT